MRQAKFALLAILVMSVAGGIIAFRTAMANHKLWYSLGSDCITLKNATTMPNDNQTPLPDGAIGFFTNSNCTGDTIDCFTDAN